MHCSIRTKMFLAMNLGVLLFAFIFLASHFLFFEDYVIGKNKDMLAETYNSINKELITNGTVDTSFMDKFESNLGLHIAILNTDYNFIYSVTMTEKGEENPLPNENITPDTRYSDIIRENKNAIEKSGYVHVIKEDKVNNSNFIYLIGVLASGDFIILRTPLPAIEANIEYSRFFIAITGILTLLLSFVWTYFISTRWVKPIVKINTITNSMAHLDFSKKYTGKNTDEVGELGHNINSLSSQLESTVHQLQKTNNRLEEELKKERQIDEMRQNLIANVSHDLKTPLAIIQGYAEGLKENIKETPEDKDFYCSVIIDEAERMNKLVRQILTLSQLEMGKLKPEFESFEVSSFINATAAKFSLMFEEKGITITNEVPKTIVSADGSMLSQVLVNLITNAADHTGQQGKIVISSSLHDNKIRIKVYNKGNTIPEEELDKIWLSFYKVDKARTRTYGGTGIGLTIVKSIIDAHKNLCGVKNREDGVEFWFELDIG
ncbi:MAG: HAMP domain-containing sensor histidine kinase [Clostridiales bacterium]